MNAGGTAVMIWVRLPVPVWFRLSAVLTVMVAGACAAVNVRFCRSLMAAAALLSPVLRV